MDLRLLRYFVVVCEEGNLGRAAARLHMTQPPLTRAVRRLKDDLGVRLLDRSAKGVSPTAAGEVLHDQARLLLAAADRARERVREAGSETLVVGCLADTVEHLRGSVFAQFRSAHPSVSIRVHEADLGDPTAGLRSGVSDVALTRGPLDVPGIHSRVIGTQRVGVVVRADDPLAAEPAATVRELEGRDWVRLPERDADAWSAYWSGAHPRRSGPRSGSRATRPESRTIQECVQAVLWDGAIALAPLDQPVPEGLVVIPVLDREPNQLLVAWRGTAQPAVTRAYVRSVVGMDR